MSVRPVVVTMETAEEGEGVRRAQIRMVPPPQESSLGYSPARHAWIERLMCSEGPAILRVLWKLLGNEQDVLDAYQDCWCSLAALPNPGNLRCGAAFAYRTAENIAIEMIRRRARRRGHWPAIVSTRGRAESDPGREPSDPSDRLREAISRLPQHLRNVIVLRDFGGRSYKEISKLLGIEPGTARVYRRQAVLKLADLLHEEQDRTTDPPSSRGDRI